MRLDGLGRRGLATGVVALVMIHLFGACAWTMAASQYLPPSFAHLVVATSPGVVTIAVKKTVIPDERENKPGDVQDSFRDMFNRLFQERIGREYLQRTTGSGFIVDRDGFILTTNHLVEDAEDIDVQLSDERRFRAILVGRDPPTDTALIRIEAGQHMQPLSFGDSDALNVGDWVVAIGNPFGLGNTVTCGIVSAKYRQLGVGIEDRFIQTDAAINPGNSGGPLINLSGEVVGINSAFLTESGESLGIGFAIPINQVKTLLPQLRMGKVRRSWLGVLTQDVTPALKQAFQLGVGGGALISQVLPNGPAAKAGMARGDVVVGFNGQKVRNARELTDRTIAVPVGTEATVEVLRMGRTMRIPVVTEERADAEARAAASQTVSFMGMRLQSLTPEVAGDFGVRRTSGVLITDVEEGSPAFDSGLEPGDIIIETNRQAVSDVETFLNVFNRQPGNHVLLILIDREGSTIYVTITPA